MPKVMLDWEERYFRVKGVTTASEAEEAVCKAFLERELSETFSVHYTRQSENAEGNPVYCGHAENFCREMEGSLNAISI